MMETERPQADSGHAEERLQVLTDPQCGGNMVQLRNIGQVEISEEATLENLKTQVIQIVNFKI